MTLKDCAAQFGLGDEDMPRLTALADQVQAACEQLLSHCARLLDAMHHDDVERCQQLADQGTEWLSTLVAAISWLRSSSAT